MKLPGIDWLRRNLAGVDVVSGGYHAKMGHPVEGGAGFQMSACFVVMWLVALVPLSVVAISRWLVRKARRSATDSDSERPR